MRDRSLRIDGYDGQYPYHNGSVGPILLDPATVQGEEADALCDPYGELEFAVGSDDDFVCFGFSLLDDGRVYLDAVVNSETGSFIMGFETATVPRERAVSAARGMVDRSIEWAIADGAVGGMSASLSLLEWDQDPLYFVRCVEAAVSGSSEEVPRLDLGVVFGLTGFGITEDQANAVEMVLLLRGENDRLHGVVSRLMKENSKARVAREAVVLAQESARAEDVLF